MSNRAEPGLVSVIIPTYNRAERVQRAIDSVIEQSYRPIELMVVDDGSTDCTADVITGYSRRHCGPAFTIRLLQKPNGGAPSARNMGLVESRGEFIQFLDSDDCLVSTKIRDQVSILIANKSVGYVWSDAVRLKESEIPQGAMPPASHGRATILRGEHKWRSPSMIVAGLFRRSSCVAIGPWNESLRCYQDWHYNAVAVMHPWHIAYLPGARYIVVEHGAPRINNIVRSADKQLEAMMLASAALLQELKSLHPSNGAGTYMLAQMYLAVSILAVRSGHKNYLRPSLAGVRKFAPLFSRPRWKAVAVGFLTRFLGARRSAPVIEAYFAHLR